MPSPVLILLDIRSCWQPTAVMAEAMALAEAARVPDMTRGIALTAMEPQAAMAIRVIWITGVQQPRLILEIHQATLHHGQ